MKAAILYGKEDVRIEDLEPAALKPGEIRVRIKAALTCGTDLKVFKRGYHAKMIVPPAVFGHELSGVIEEISAMQSPQGNGTASPWAVGDRVVAANSAPCGDCFHCRQGQENICDDLLFLNGAYAQSIVVPERIVRKNLLRLQPDTAFADAALIEPLACVVQGIEDALIRAGQRVLILGAGPIGLMFVALAKKLGCVVTVAGRRAVRLQAAERLGADHVVDIKEGSNLVAKIRDAGAGQFDVVIEAVGAPAVWEAAVHLVRKGGTVNFFGGCPAGTTVALDTSIIHYSDLTLLASFHHTPRTIRRALEFVEAGAVRAGDFVDGECPLSRLPQLFQGMAKGNHAVKTLIQVNQ
ncbi:MAG TPA: zinc-binding dehydrogenase [Verrucomicrobiae bacterium]|nr:zinc-binding dehydrogenase [Verrucomicrobiae bacterium]